MSLLTHPLMKLIVLWSIADSNRLPFRCERNALPDELMPRLTSKNEVAKVLFFSEMVNT